MTVKENLGFSLKIAKVDKKEIEQRVKEAVQILGLDELQKRKPSQLSGGQRQRVAMGRAIVRRPDAFLFDEPLSNLDAKLRTQMRTEIKKLHQKLHQTGKSILRINSKSLQPPSIIHPLTPLFCKVSAESSPIKAIS